MILKVELHPSTIGALREACVAMGGHPLQQLLTRVVDQVVEINDKELAIMRDYLDRIGVGRQGRGCL